MVVTDLLSNLESSQQNNLSSSSVALLTSETPNQNGSHTTNRTIGRGDRESIKMPPKSSNNTNPEPRLIVPLLTKVPQQIRFGIAGFLSNLIFMVWYNGAIDRFEKHFAASTIYAVTYLFFIPVSHALMSCIVFGWPTRYIKSLMSNAPIGLTAIVIGAACTAYLDRIGFQILAEEWIEYYIMGVSSRPNMEETDDPPQASGEFYSSLVVMVITGVWSYVLSVLVNAPPAAPEKKQL